MEREVLNVGKTEKPFASHSTIELNLEETDENELYTRMIYRIEEEIQSSKVRKVPDGILLKLLIYNYIPHGIRL